MKKQWFKIAVMAAPVLALVIATLLNLGESERSTIEQVLIGLITVVGGAMGVTGIVMNNDKNGNGIPDDQEKVNE